MHAMGGNHFTPERRLLSVIVFFFLFIFQYPGIAPRLHRLLPPLALQSPDALVPHAICSCFGGILCNVQCANQPHCAAVICLGDSEKISKYASPLRASASGRGPIREQQLQAEVQSFICRKQLHGIRHAVVTHVHSNIPLYTCI